jgi:hypothetical protein
MTKYDYKMSNYVKNPKNTLKVSRNVSFPAEKKQCSTTSPRPNSGIDDIYHFHVSESLNLDFFQFVGSAGGEIIN